MNYWLDLFTGQTWDQFQKAGSQVSGFNKRSAKLAARVRPEDILLCYLTGVSRWVGALRVLGPTTNVDPIWGEGAFPVRFAVEPLVLLKPEHGIPMAKLEGKVQFYKTPKQKGKFNGFVRQSLNKFAIPDAGYIMSLLNEAKVHPAFLPVDPKKLAKKPFFQVKLKKGDKSVCAVVSIPEEEEQPSLPGLASLEETSEHTAIQYELLRLGAAMGFDVWVARNDRKKKANGVALGAMNRALAELPTQFSEPAQKIIELIDVLWLDKKTIVAAFEVEHTTSVYSGLLRMSDLLALVPNLNVKLYLVAPEERQTKVESEVLRPTFTMLSPPLKQVCRFISFEILKKKSKIVREHDLAGALKPDFLDSFSEGIGESASAATG